MYYHIDKLMFCQQYIRKHLKNMLILLDLHPAIMADTIVLSFPLYHTVAAGLTDQLILFCGQCLFHCRYPLLDIALKSQNHISIVTCVHLYIQMLVLSHMS